MADLKMNLLFKKKIINYENQSYEIFELIDFVPGINFTNRDNEKLCNIMFGNYTGKYAYYVYDNIDDNQLAFLDVELEKVLELNDNRVDFCTIREKIISSKKYYKKNDDKTSLINITNKEFISYLNKYNEQTASDFDENEFKKSSDISYMYSLIKNTIISQDEQIMKILTSLFKNQKVVNSNLDSDLIAKLKENVLICGPTGTGKTEILRRISKIYNIPMVIEDATSLSETGYVGRKITDMLEDLYLAADKNIELAEKGILVIDEFDKLAEVKGDNQSHVSRLGVQRSLLKLFDGTLFYFDDKKFDTSKLSIIVLGAFTGITKEDNYKNLTIDDFIEFGIIRELMGRISKTIYMNPLKKEDIVKILKESDFSPLNTYKKLFEMLKVEFEFNDEFVEYIAEQAVAKQSGARSLKTVFDECISSALFRIFAGEYSKISLVKPDDEKGKPYVLTNKKSTL